MTPPTDDGDFLRLLSLLFEPAPALATLLLRARPFASYSAVIDHAERLFLDSLARSRSPSTSSTAEETLLSMDDLVAIVNAHPRIGEKSENLSALSRIEQGYAPLDKTASVGSKETPPPPPLEATHKDTPTQAPKETPAPTVKNTQTHKDTQKIGTHPTIINRLASLNALYESHFNFRFVVFVNNRPRSAIIPLIESRIASSTREKELSSGLQAMIDIARDRLKKGLVTDEIAR